MDNFSYRTIISPGQGVYKEKGSRFLAFAFPVDAIEDVEIQLGLLRKQYHDARHHCYAWTLGADKKRYRANDDGEPAHSAGDPILGQIRSRDLTNVLVVVVRYFGGVKLGVGGLITAYRLAASLALDNCAIAAREVTSEYIINFPYDSMPEVMKLMKSLDVKMGEQNFFESCQTKVDVLLRNEHEFVRRLELLQALGNGVQFEKVI